MNEEVISVHSVDENLNGMNKRTLTSCVFQKVRFPQTVLIIMRTNGLRFSEGPESSMLLLCGREKEGSNAQ